MEKFSTWRDAGTGIQPFLTPVPPLQQAPTWLKIYNPFGYLIGAVRTVVLLVPLLLYAVGCLVSIVLSPLSPVYRLLDGLLVAICTRLTLLLLGFWWISTEVVSRKRGRSISTAESWKPRAGDIIVSNWASWVEILWLAFKWNPIFLVPVVDKLPVDDAKTSGPATPGRRTGTGSAAIASPAGANTSRQRIPVLGYRPISFLGMIGRTGYGPIVRTELKGDQIIRSLEDIRKEAKRPVVVFPECTSSNGRALLRLADAFKDYALPVKGLRVFVMCVRYDPPTPTSPSLTHSIPAGLPFILPNPLPHAFSLLSAPAISRSMSIRLLSLADSPSSPTFMASEYLTPGATDATGEAIAQLIAFLGKFKRTTVLGWEEKTTFLDFYRLKSS